MALELTWSNDQGFTAPTAYFRVSEIQLNYIKKGALIRLSIYKDETARREAKRAMGILEYSIVDYEGHTDFSDFLNVDALNREGNNIVRAVYTWLKQQPELQNALDV